VQEVFGVSERRACRVLGQSRTTQQRPYPAATEEETALIGRMRELAQQHPRYGYRRIWALLVAEGWHVNRKRIYRLWKQAGLKVRNWPRKQPRPGGGENACHVRRPEYPNHVWSYDITTDQTVDGRGLKFLVVLDEFTRRCLALEVGRSMTSHRVVSVLEELVRIHGAPGGMRSDNGPEFVAKRVKDWLENGGIETLYIEPGSPWQNGYIESFNSRLEDEFLSQQSFRGTEEAEVLAEHYRLEYNHVRPHSALEYQTPVRFATEWRPASVASAPAALQPSYTPSNEGNDNRVLETALP